MIIHDPELGKIDLKRGLNKEQKEMMKKIMKREGKMLK